MSTKNLSSIVHENNDCKQSEYTFGKVKNIYVSDPLPDSILEFVVDSVWNTLRPVMSSSELSGLTKKSLLGRLKKFWSLETLDAITCCGCSEISKLLCQGDLWCFEKRITIHTTLVRNTMWLAISESELTRL
jgi:hypothetical protein